MRRLNSATIIVLGEQYVLMSRQKGNASNESVSEVDSSTSLEAVENNVSMKAQPTTTVRTHRDFFGSSIGIIAFLGGVALLLLVFKLAYDMFKVPPGQAVGTSPGKVLDLNASLNSFIGVFIRILLLMVMGLVGSWIANRGISLYTQARSVKVNVEEG